MLAEARPSCLTRKRLSRVTDRKNFPLRGPKTGGFAPGTQPIAYPSLDAPPRRSGPPVDPSSFNRHNPIRGAKEARESILKLLAGKNN